MTDLLERIHEALRVGGYSPQRRGDRIRSKCPAHGGDNPTSLHVTRGHTVEVALKCHSMGCSYADILGALGIEREENKRNVSPDADPILYVYRNADGAPLYAKRRHFPKRFDWVQPGKRDEWVKGRGEDALVPYRLPELIDAVKAGETIFVCEGEKDVDIAYAMGLSATTFPDGASAKLLPSYRGWFKGADVVVVPDRDKPGQQYSANVMDLLKGFAKSVAKIDLPYPIDEAHGKDLADWFGDGHTSEELRKMVSESWREDGCAWIEEWGKQEFNLELHHFGMSGMGAKIGCYMPGIGAGTLMTIAARPSVGKTAWMCELVWRIVTSSKSAKVMFVSLDEPARRIANFIAGSYAGDLRYTTFPRAKDVNDAKLPMQRIMISDKAYGPDAIMAKAAVFRPDFLFLDHVALVDKSKRNDSDIDRISDAMKALRGIARDLKCAVVVASQFNREVETIEGLATMSNLYGADAIGQHSDIVIGIQRPGQKGCRPEISAAEAEKTAGLDDGYEFYRVIHVLKNRFGGAGGGRWYRLCGPERRFFQLHQAKCQCSECDDHRALIKTRSAALTERASNG